jgi:two-component system sensor histidine kinase PilS (NtrC family)
MSILAPSAEAEASGLYNRLTYLTAIRLVLVTALLGGTAWQSLRAGEPVNNWTLTVLLYGLVAFVYAVSLGYLWLLRRRRQLQPLAYAEVAGDLLVATFLVYLTGGYDSLFTLMFPLAIVNAAILLNRPGAVVAAAGSVVMFVGLSVALTQNRILPASPYLEQHRVEPSRLIFILLANATAFVLTAAFASYLSEQLRTTGERLKEREVDYAALSELHGSILRGMSAGILTTNVNGRVTFMNTAAEQILSIRFEQLIDQPLRDWFPALSAAIESSLAKHLNRGDVDEKDGRGEARRLSFAVNPLTRASEKRRQRGRRMEPGLAIVFEDLTALREMQEAVRRGDRLAAVGQLAAGLAHELRNPLASMSGAVELLARNRQLSDAERRLMEIVTREAERLNALVTDFLAFARPTATQLRPTDVAALADETLGVFRHSPKATKIELLRSGSQSLRIMADAAQLRQVLWNLLQNAAEAMQGEGDITVDVGWTPSGLCRVAVADSGPGISQADTQHLFEPFFTTKEAGTGLGLAFVHRIVEAHLGRVEVQSSLGQGATFSVLLPAGMEMEEADTDPNLTPVRVAPRV